MDPKTSTARKRALTLGGVAGAAALLTVGATPAQADTPVDRPDTFTSAYTVMATPDQVINPEGKPAPGEEGATGTFNFMINSDEEIICYDITLTGVTTPYESKAKTATHIHAAKIGEGGPPRLAFPNPEGEGDVKTSSGCIKGPFTTGLPGDDGVDTGKGFSLKDIEAAPTSFSADTHTANFVPGTVRGQLKQVPVGGVDTGMGGQAAPEGMSQSTILALAGSSIAVLGVSGTLLARRRARA